MSTAILQEANAPNQLDPANLPREINGLMLRYCDAIEACESIPVLSLLPAIKLSFQFLLWELSLLLCFFTALIDLPLLLTRGIFGRPRFVLGRTLYGYVTRPFRSAWAGEIPAFKVSRARYLTLILLLYHAQSRITALHSAFNRRHLAILATKPVNPAAVNEAEELQKSFDLFEKMTKDNSVFGVLAVGGPLIALLSIFIQKVVLPGMSYLWSSIGGLEFNPELLGAILYFVIIAMWVLISAWADMRTVLIAIGVCKFERDAYAGARINYCRELPLDLIWYFVFGGFFLGQRLPHVSGFKSSNLAWQSSQSLPRMRIRVMAYRQSRSPSMRPRRARLGCVGR